MTRKVRRMKSDTAITEAMTTDMTPKIYRTIQLATIMFLIGLVIGLVLRGETLPL